MLRQSRHLGLSGEPEWVIVSCRNQLKVVVRGLDPRIHAVTGVASARFEDVDAHGTSPWAEGPRIKSGHGNSKLLKGPLCVRIRAHGKFPRTGLRHFGDAFCRRRGNALRSRPLRRGGHR